MTDRLKASSPPPLRIGDNVPPYGKIRAVSHASGERYYWFSRGRGDLLMLPAVLVECPEKVQ